MAAGEGESGDDLVAAVACGHRQTEQLFDERHARRGVRCPERHADQKVEGAPQGGIVVGAAGQPDGFLRQPQPRPPVGFVEGPVGRQRAQHTGPHRRFVFTQGSESGVAEHGDVAVGNAEVQARVRHRGAAQAGG